MGGGGFERQTFIHQKNNNNLGTTLRSTLIGGAASLDFIKKQTSEDYMNSDKEKSSIILL
jgi:hypothetical protein